MNQFFEGQIVYIGQNKGIITSIDLSGITPVCASIERKIIYFTTDGQLFPNGDVILTTYPTKISVDLHIDDNQVVYYRSGDTVISCHYKDVPEKYKVKIEMSNPLL